MNTEKKSRNSGMDLLRIFALFCVVGVHFFLNMEFGDFPVAGKRMYAMVTMRSFCMICVPLFLLLTGYLMGSKKPTARYYLGLIKVLVIYLLASLCCGFYKIKVLHEPISAMGMLAGIASFTTADYAWYVEMYIGLFLIAPFLNLAYDGLQTQSKKKILIAVLLVMTALPGVTNIFCAEGVEWWLTPKICHNYLQILPTYWVGCYPITYYILGRYLKEYPIKMGKLMNLLLIFAVLMANSSFNFYRSHTTNYLWGIWQDEGALPTVVLAVAVFNFFASLDCEKLPDGAKKGLHWVSNWVLAAYLVSWIFDTEFYPVLIEKVPVMHLRLEYFPVMVPVVAGCSLALGGVLYGIYWLTAGQLLKWLRGKVKE